MSGGRKNTYDRRGWAQTFFDQRGGEYKHFYTDGWESLCVGMGGSDVAWTNVALSKRLDRELMV